MFRAISDYFFGGVAEEPPSTLETQEVNDWLVVNLTDRPQDDVVMIESTKLDPMSESEYEDILDAVSCLMRPVEPEPESEMEQSDGESVVESSDSSEEEDEEEDEEDDDEIDEEELDVNFKNSVCPLTPESCPNEMCLVHGRQYGRVIKEWKVLSGLDILRALARRPPPQCFTSGHWVTEQEVVEHFEPSPRDKPCTFREIFQVESLIEHAQMLVEKKRQAAGFIARIKSHPQVQIAGRGLCQEIQPKRPAIVLPRRYERMSPLVKDPAPLHKEEIQRRIQEVERDQKLKRYRNEKVLTKGQLNHQNKNYLFQSSCKKNRRRDLQRSHSGANNNRKCSSC